MQRAQAKVVDVGKASKCTLANYTLSIFSRSVLLDLGEPTGPQDGMDQSKWAIPRVRGDRISKEFEQLDRPRTKVHGIWVHYHELMFFVADARTSTGSDFVIECACRALERVVARCHSNNMPVPTEIVIWCDNTVSETKNAWVLQWLCVLLLKRKFRFACVQMSLVGIRTTAWTKYMVT